MSRRTCLLLGALALGLLALACILVHRPVIESDLRDRSSRALAAAGVTAPELSFRGRDATLTGQVASKLEAARAVAEVEGVHGVRVVRDRMTVGMPSAPAALPVPLRLTAERTGGRVLLRGTVPSEDARGELRARARALPGVSVVDDELKVVGGLAVPSWLGDLPSVVDPLQASVKEGAVHVAGDVVTLEGLVPSEAERRRIVTATRDRLGPSVEVRDRLRVQAPAAPPRPDPKAAQAELDRILTGTVIEFETSSATLSSGGRLVLDRIAEALRRFGDVNVAIAGHTDSRGDAQSNMDLSRRRAAAVRTYLMSRGVVGSRMQTTGHGETAPVAGNDTAEGRRQNRRIELSVLGENAR